MRNMKRWLAVLMSATVAFGGAGVSQLSTVAAFAAEAEATSENVAQVTIGTTTTNFKTIAEAIEEVNANKDANKTVVLKLLANADVGEDRIEVNSPLTIDLNGFTIANSGRLVAGPARIDKAGKIGTTGEFGICRSENYKDTKLSKIIFAKHVPSFEYHWASNEEEHTLYVDGYYENCDNCGLGTRLFPVYGINDFNEKNGHYEYSEDGVVLAWKDAKEGYTLISGPSFDKDGTKTKYKEDGTPIVIAEVAQNKDGAKVNADIKVTKATKQDFYDHKDDEEPMENRDADCEHDGTIWYKVVVTAPDGIVLYDGFMEDDHAVEKLGHKKGEIKAIQILTKHSVDEDGDYYYSEASAMQAGIDETGSRKSVVKVTKEKNEEDDVVYSWWSWEDSTEEDRITVGDNVDKQTGSISYRVNYYCDRCHEEDVFGDVKEVTPLTDAKTKSEADAANKAYADGKIPKNSVCETWYYPQVSEAYEYHVGAGATISNTKKISFTSVEKPEAKWSHVADTNKEIFTIDATCSREGAKYFTCAICGKEHVSTKIPTNNNHSFVVPKASEVKDLTYDQIDNSLEERHGHVVSFNADYSIATISATCTEDGGTYKFCENGGGHWVKQSTIEATGHKLSNVAIARYSHWEDPSGNDFESYNPENDYTFSSYMTCSNPNCGGELYVTYHSISGENVIGDSDADIYNAISVEDQDKGIDCATNAKTIYTVKDIKGQDGKAVTKVIDKGPATKGTEHKIAVTKWNWSSDFKQASVTGTCSLCKETNQRAKATVAQTTEANGLTTFTATYEGSTDTKKAYSLKDAVVTFDASGIKDINRVVEPEFDYEDYIHVDGGASQIVPEVTVTINGTVINSNLYNVTWERIGNNKVRAVVDWKPEVKKTTAAEHVDATAASDEVNVEAKNQIDDVDYELKTNGKRVAIEDTDYNPKKEYSLVAKPTPSNVTVKYAVLDEEEAILPKDYETANDFLKAIEAIDYDLDSIEGIKDAGKYYFYAQITADGYTPYTEYVGGFEITRPKITVKLDNATSIVGEMPELNMRAYADGKALDIDMDDFEITTSGGQELDELDAGTYKLMVVSDNYHIADTTTENQYLATLTVLPKDEATVADQKAAQDVIDQLAALNDSSSAADVQKAVDAYNALTPSQKAIVDANSSAVANLDKANKKVEENKAQKAAADKKAANAVIAMLNKVDTKTSAADAKKAMEAYNKLTADQKKLVDANAGAKAGLSIAKKTVAASKKATLKASKIKKVKLAKAKFSKKVLKKKKQATKIKVTKTGNGKLTFKKTSKAKKFKKIVISKKGKVTLKKGLKKGTYKVKVKVSMAKTKTYKATSKTVTLKIKVK